MKQFGLLLLIVVLGLGYYYRDRLVPYMPAWAAAYVAPDDATATAATKSGDGTAGGTKSASADATGGKGGGKSGGRHGGSGPVAIRVAVASTGTLPLTRQTIGTIVPVNTTSVASEIAGRLEEIPVKDGAMVTKGQLLAKLDDRTIRAQIEKDQAQMAKDQATLSDAESSYARTKHLVSTGVNAAQTGDDALTAVKVAQGTLAVDRATLASDQVQLSQTEVRAPFDGRLGAVQLSAGAYVSAGTALVRITQMKPVLAEFSLSEADLALIRRAEGEGTLKAVITPTMNGGEVAPPKVTGPIVFIDSQVTGGSSTVTMRANLENLDEAFWPGQSINVTVEAGASAQMVLVPGVAVMPRQDGSQVFVLKSDGTVAAREVQVALRVGDVAGLSGGLKPGEKVVVEGQGQIVDGSHVKVVTTPPAGTAPAPKKAGEAGIAGETGGTPTGAIKS